MIYYHNFDAIDEWPEDIQNIVHLMFMGAMSAFDFGKPCYAVFREMMMKRTTSHFRAYGLWFNHRRLGFDKFITIKNGKEEQGEKVAYVDINNSEIGVIFPSRGEDDNEWSTLIKN